MSRLVVKGGDVVFPDRVERGDVLVVDGRIAAVGEVDPGDGEVVDAGGLLVFPGMVDTHVHLMDPGSTDREDFPTGTRAAAARGVTTIVEHTHAHPIKTVADFEEKRRYLEGRANVDYGLAAHVWPEHVADLADLWRAGITFFKIFTCTTHGVPGLDPADLLAAFRRLAEVGAPCLVHCEDEDITAEAERLLRESGRSDPGVLIEWRNREAELAAVAATGVLAASTGVKATIAHVSNPKVAQVITSAREWGADLAAETCPQYLSLREEEVLEHGPFRKFTPPARIRTQEDEEDMWRLVRTGVFTHISTDHAPSTKAQKGAGTIWDAPFGLPGLDTTFPFLLDAGLGGKIELSDVARLYAAAPADRYGLAPAKGRISVGADADLVLVDPSSSWTVTEGDLVSKAGWSPFEGRTFRGRVVATFLRGTQIADEHGCFELRSGRLVSGGGVS